MLQILFLLTFTPKVYSIYHIQAPVKEECNCFCFEPSTSEVTVCQKLSRFEKELSTVKDAIEYRTRYINEIKELREKLEWQDDFIEKLSKQMDSFKLMISRTDDHVILPQPLTMKPEDQMQNDSGMTFHTMEEDRELAKNVSNLLAKVEVVENMTMEVQEQLKSERRVRRHLEEDLSETRSSIKILGDKFLNFSLPVDSRVSHVEEIVFSSLEALNKSLIEEHLQKLYYRMDGVVYKNETRKLDERLENVETGLLGTNTTTIQKLADDLKNLTEAFNVLNETIEERLASEENRLEVIETKASKLNELELQDHQFTLNISDLMENKTVHLRSDMQKIQNFTRFIQSAFESRMSQNENMTKMGKEKLEDFNSRLSDLRYNISETQNMVIDIKKEVSILAADVAITENKVLDLTFQLGTGFEEVDAKLVNMTEKWMKEFDENSQFISKESEDMQETKNKSMEELKVVTEIPTKTEEYEEGEFPTTHYSFQVGNEIDADLDNDFDGNANNNITFETHEESVCSLPVSNNSNLLITIDHKGTGEQQLVFGCHPLGQYALSETLVPVRCKDRSWTGVFPKCVKLLSEENINDLANKLATLDPCLSNKFYPDFPDPIDCSRYFKCWNGGMAERSRCPANLHFNPVSKKCENVNISRCQSYETQETYKLKFLLPTILIDPEMVDKPYGLMATSSSGHLVVYPGMSFQMHCVYPQNMWGDPEWNIDLFSGNSTSASSLKTSRNRMTLSVRFVSVQDSGVYSCTTPFGKQLSITVVVKDVTCPAFSSEHDVFYRPHPEGGYRMMTSQAQFFCDGELTISVTCLASGLWSRTPPSLDECPPRGSNLVMPWGCPPIDLEGNPDLFLEPKEVDKVVNFKCAGKTKLIGSPFSRCTDAGTWSHSKLPKCIPHTNTPS